MSGKSENQLNNADLVMNSDRQNQIFNFLNIINSALTKETKELVVPDWKVLCTFARQQSLLPLFLEGCSHYPDFLTAPENIRKRLFENSVYIITDQVQRTEVFLGVYNKLLSAGIQPIVLKGLICRNTYRELADYRPSGDEDIYIKKEQFELCKRILTSNGFIMEDFDITDKFLLGVQAIDFINPANGLEIEVHINPFGNRNRYREKMNTYFMNSFDNAIHINVSGHSICTLNYTEHFLFLIFHFYKHFISNGVGLRQLIDILMFDKAHHNDIDRSAVNKCLKEMSADRLYGDILALGRRYLGFSVYEIDDGFHPEALLEDIMEAGIFGKNTRDLDLSRHVTEATVEDGGFHLLKTVFPKTSELTGGYPVLYKKPYLLPFIWILRCIKFMRENKHDHKLITRSIETGKRRVLLLKMYGII